LTRIWARSRWLENPVQRSRYCCITLRDSSEASNICTWIGLNPKLLTWPRSPERCHVRAIRASTLAPLLFLLARSYGQRPSTCPGMFAWRRNGFIPMRRRISWPYEAKCPTLFPMPARSAVRECREVLCVRHFATTRRDPGWSGARDPMHASPKRLARTFGLHRAAWRRIPTPR
jgi:hypothetical protein